MKGQRIAVAAIAAPAAITIWGGWVGLGGMTGFGPIHPLPGIWDSLVIDTSVTLPIGMEAYAALALGVWLGRRGSARAQAFAKRSAIAALLLGALGQVAYHLLEAAGKTSAPLPVTVLVACLPVGVLGMASALLHLLKETPEETPAAVVEEAPEEVPEAVIETPAPAPAPAPEPKEKPAPEKAKKEEAPTPTPTPAPKPAPLRSIPSPLPEGVSKTEQAIAILREEPEVGSKALADRLGCDPSLVRQARRRLAAEAA